MIMKQGRSLTVIHTSHRLYHCLHLTAEHRILWAKKIAFNISVRQKASFIMHWVQNQWKNITNRGKVTKIWLLNISIWPTSNVLSHHFYRIYAKFFVSMLYNSTYLFFTCWAHFWLQNFPSGTNSSMVP